jgi:virulence factor Mce-like protein
VDHRIPSNGLGVGIALAVIALATFLFLNSRFEGPDPLDALRSPYELTAEFPNSKKLPTKQPVLYRGIPIGRVTKVEWDARKRVARVRFVLDEGFRVHEDAVIRIGERSLLGDPYLNLVSRGSPDRPALGPGDEIADARPSVNFDEALAFLDREGRRSVQGLLRELARGTAAPGAAAGLNATVGGLERSLDELYGLTRALRGQERHITRLVEGSATVLDVLAEREAAVREIVSGGRRTLAALGGNQEALTRAIRELPAALRAGREALAASEPLLAETEPLLGEVRALAPDLHAALRGQGPSSLAAVLAELERIGRGLGPLARQGKPTLGRAHAVLLDLRPLVQSIAPAARNLAPAVEYLAPRARAIASGFALLADVASGRDSVGHYVRSGARLLELEETLDLPLGACDPNEPGNRACRNAYPEPDDALDPQPFSGPYPRIVPCRVPSRATPRKPCE